MAKTILMNPSRTLMEFRLLPGLTATGSAQAHVTTRTTIVRSPSGGIELAIPLISAAMQSVSGVAMAIELAKLGGAAVLFASQTPEDQAGMVRSVKSYRAGFVNPRTVSENTTVREVEALREQLGYATFPVLSPAGVFVGLVAKHDYDSILHADLAVSTRMVSRDKLTLGHEGIGLEEAHALLLDSHQGVLPIVDSAGQLSSMVFRSDIRSHLDTPEQRLDAKGRLVVFAALNTHDYKDRAPALAAAEVDAFVIDASDGHSVFQGEAVSWLKREFPNVPVIAGNVITAEGFTFLAAAGADAVKVGMGGGSICITQEQKGTGRGLATAVLEVVTARDAWRAKTGQHIPVIADGGIETARDITMALAMGADACMMGRYFARMEESPTDKVVVNGRVMKPYWGEGAARARHWRAQRYSQNAFVEGVEGFVDYAGKLRDNLPESLAKIRASMSSCGAATLAEFRATAVLELISALSIREGQVHDIYMPTEGTASGAPAWGA